MSCKQSNQDHKPSHWLAPLSTRSCIIRFFGKAKTSSYQHHQSSCISERLTQYPYNVSLCNFIKSLRSQLMMWILKNAHRRFKPGAITIFLFSYNISQSSAYAIGQAWLVGKLESQVSIHYNDLVSHQCFHLKPLLSE